MTVTDAERERIIAARRYTHKATCPQSQFTDTCAACPSPLGTLYALRHLDLHPRDAKGARRALHDAVCGSGCRPDDDHADRTQAKPAAALRRFRANEGTHSE